MKQYIINENDLLRLLKANRRLYALECGGVDNWEWYSESLREYLQNTAKNFGLDEEEEDFDFYDIAIQDISNYAIYEKN